MKYIALCITLLPFGVMAGKKNIKPTSITVHNLGKSVSFVSLSDRKNDVDRINRWEIESSQKKTILIKKSSKRAQFLTFYLGEHKRKIRVTIDQEILIVPSKLTRPLIDQ